jgi:capsular polysaccharide biosynthesis protein
MEIREYDPSYELLNQHLYTNKSVYGLKRYPPIFLKYKDQLMEIIKKKWNFNDDIFKEHIVFFANHKHVLNHYNNTNTYIINCNYQPFGQTYYHVLTEVLPNAIFLSNIIDDKKIPILVPESKFILNIFKWFDVKNPILFKLDNNNYNFIKQQTTECGFPSPQKLLSLREIIDKKVTYKKELGVYIYRKENWRQIKNSEEIFNIIKKKFNNIEWIQFNDQDLDEAINIFSRAKIIIAPHGAGLTNMIFSPREIIIIEIMPIQETNLCYWHQSCIFQNKHYIYPENYISQTNRNFNINIDEFTKILISINI